MQSINHSDASSYDWPSTPSLGLPSSPYSSADGQSVTRTPSPSQVDYFGRRAPSRPGSGRSTSSDERVYETSIYAFLFSDVVVFGTPLSERNPLLQNTRRSKRAFQWQLLSDVGLARVLGCNQVSDKFGFEFVLELDLLPISSDDVARSPATMSLTLSESSPASIDAVQAMKKTWINAFESSMFNTLRSISFPSIAPFQLPLEGNVNPSSPTSPSWRSVTIPRSPSAFAQSIANPVETERGEREWWSHRFKQVEAEFIQDRNNRPILVEVQTTPDGQYGHTREKSDRRKRMSTIHHGGPAPLELVTSSTVNGKQGEKGGMRALPDSQSGIMRLLSRRDR